MNLRSASATLLAVMLLNPAIFAPTAFAAPPPVPLEHTATPIKHLVVIFQENISFDHYFGTYPVATNPVGEPSFHARPGTPAVNGFTPALLTNNPNLNTANNATLKSGSISIAANPFRLDRSQAATADQDHNYGPEQAAFHAGLMDLFPLSVGTEGPPPNAPPAAATTTALTMGYFDGNTVTAFWNYAQHFAMSDNMYDTNFGPSTPGALNVISGQTNGITSNLSVLSLNSTYVSDGGGGYTLISDADPEGDKCSSTSKYVAMGGQNIGDLLNNEGISWGFFAGGFDLTVTNPNGTTGCARTTTSAVTGSTETDYIPHHQPFQYYTSTQNLAHTRPSSVRAIGEPSDAVAHNQYDVHDFFDAINAGNFPEVSYLKPPGYQDGHAGYSDPLDEQDFVTTVINFLQQRPEWSSTAVIITYDDSDGWYDHQMSPIVNQSVSPADDLNGTGLCGATTTPSLPGINTTTSPSAKGRCGYGPRLPFIVVSPWAKENFVSHTIIDQSSVVRFIEDNWLGGQRLGGGSFDAIADSIEDLFDFSQPECRPDKLFLNVTTGEPIDLFPGFPPRFPFWF